MTHIYYPAKVSKCNMMSEALKHCPFCGGEARHYTGKAQGGKPWHYVRCVDCGALGPTPPSTDHNTSVIEGLTEAWNTRATRMDRLRAKMASALDHAQSLPPK
mgnify:CR=1 FL=1